MIPSGSKVLDIGAGNGILALLLQKKLSDLIIDGIEPNRYAAELARSNYRHFYVGYCQDFFDIIAHENYDFIILADVVEHMADPLEFLTELGSILSDRTKIILSTPNIAFGAIKLALLKGHFNYTDSGILERTHLRFFTFESLKVLISNSGLYIQKVVFLQRSFLNSETRIENLKISPFLFHTVKQDPMSLTYQFLLILSKESSSGESIFVQDLDRFVYLRYLVMRHRNIPVVKFANRVYHSILEMIHT
jgi:2-polyprenyl-3-methyl-5-hydroxy-6-metoxy-1,4-benzoquinol methylase